MATQRILDLFGIRFPIVQAGMVWCSGWRLASAVSEAGGLGLIGSGSMTPTQLEKHIRLCRAATTRPFGVNVPLLYSRVEEMLQIIAKEGVPIVFTSAGNPATWTRWLKDRGITVVHVVSSVRFAKKSEAAGVDAVVAEGFEAGGHNGREETTTLCLLPMVREAISLPLLAAGGIASGRAMVATEALGAEGFQIGTRFAVSAESSAHDNFKQRVITSDEGDTVLTLKSVTPVRLLRNAFYQQVADAEKSGATPEQLGALLGKGRARQGIFDGDLTEGELEIGQVAAAVRAIEPAAEIIRALWTEYQEVKKQLSRP
jgi:enoyl-[acyl-carrier protein] reductase II